MSQGQISEKLVESLIDEAYQRGYDVGLTEATILGIDEYLGTERCIQMVYARTRRDLSRVLKDMNPGHIPTQSDYDCTGKVCGRYARLLRAYRSHYADDSHRWVGIVEVSIARDV